jgi:hypothetical protein
MSKNTKFNFPSEETYYDLCDKLAEGKKMFQKSFNREFDIEYMELIFDYLQIHNQIEDTRQTVAEVMSELGITHKPVIN